jgi:CMP-N-acetylneuraminic acid synthetase
MSPLKSISVVINARTASTRVPNKLLRPFGQTSLIEIALEKLDALDFFEKRFLAAHDKPLLELLETGRYPNVELLPRQPDAVKKGVNPLAMTFGHYLNVPSDWIFVFNPCLPFVTIETLKNAWKHFQDTSFNSYTAVVKTGDWIFDSDGHALTNNDPKNATTNKNRSFYKGCHAFHIHSKKFFKDQGILWTFKPNDPSLIEVPEEQAIDVDTMIEFEFAEFAWQRRAVSGDSRSAR